MRLTQVLYLLLTVAAALVATAEIGSGRAKQPSRSGGGGGGSVGRQKEAPLTGGRGKGKHSNAAKGNGKESGGGDKRPMVWLNFTEANKQIDWLIKKKYKKAKAALKKQRKPTRDQAKQKACHSMAILRCGCTALGNYEAELNRSKTVPLDTKCTIRKNFFRCLDDSETATHCRHSKALKLKSSYRHHMKEIVRVLWSTRGCLLGVDDTPLTSRVNSAFCAKLYGVGGGGGSGSATGGKKRQEAESHRSGILIKARTSGIKVRPQDLIVTQFFREILDFDDVALNCDRIGSPVT